MTVHVVLFTGDLRVHRPWTLPAARRDGLAHPGPIVDLSAALDHFRQARGLR